jgi:hypothetical protein
VEAYLTEVNGAPIALWASSLVYEMTQYACAVNNDDIFQQVLRDAHEATLKEMQERAEKSKDTDNVTWEPSE